MNPPLGQAYRRSWVMGRIALRLCVPGLLVVGVLSVMASVPASATRAPRITKPGAPTAVTAVAVNGPASSLVSVTPSSPNCSTIGPDANLQGCNLTGANLTGANVTGANLTDATLTDATLTDADLNNANLTGANLTDANLSSLVMFGLGGADLIGANLTDANLTNASLTDVTLVDANVAGANLNFAPGPTGVSSGGITGTPAELTSGWILFNGYLIGAEASLGHADLAGADLAGADLTGVILLGANLTDANLTDANLTDANMNTVILTGANLTGANLTGVPSGGITGTPSALPTDWTLVSSYLIGPTAYLYGADLPNADLTNADLANANLEDATLTDATLTGADLFQANLSSFANLTGANLTGANLTAANLNTVILIRANLTNADLNSVNLTGNVLGDEADLTDANLTGANLTDATLTGATLSGVIWSNTICPDGTNSNNDGDMCASEPNPTPTTSVLKPSNGATLSGSTYLGAAASDATSAEFRLFGGVYGYVAQMVCTLTPTIYGWLCGWNTASVPNGSYTLVSKAFNQEGSTSSSGVDITIDNPPPTTSVLIPANGATLSGSTYIDASASNAASVELRLLGGSYGFSGPVVCTATLTIYGWLCSWKTTTVPNGSYFLASEAFNSLGSAFSPVGISITVHN